MGDYSEILFKNNDVGLQKLIAKRPVNNQYIADFIFPPVQLTQPGGMIDYQLADEAMPSEQEALMTSRSEGSSFVPLKKSIAYGTRNYMRTARILYDTVKACQSASNPEATFADKQARALDDVKAWFLRLKEGQAKTLVDANFQADGNDGRTHDATAKWTTTESSAEQVLLDIIKLLDYAKKKTGKYIKKAFCPAAVSQIALAAIGNKITLDTYEKMLLTPDLESTWNQFKMLGLTITTASATYKAKDSSDYTDIWSDNYFYLINNEEQPVVDYAYPTYGFQGQYPDQRATNNFLVLPREGGRNWEADVITNWGLTVMDQNSLFRITGPVTNGAVTPLVDVSI
jgi:hypothetical protein